MHALAGPRPAAVLPTAQARRNHRPLAMAATKPTLTPPPARPARMQAQPRWSSSSSSFSSFSPRSSTTATRRLRAYTSSSPGGAAADQESFRSVEALITRTLSGSAAGGSNAGSGNGGDGAGRQWRQVEGSWVLFPPPGGKRPEAVVSFLGGAFVGAAPQLAYGPLLEAVAARGAVVVATPYQLSFDHGPTADRVQYDLERCLRALDAEAEDSLGTTNLPRVSALPLWGLGHSLGSLLHLLVCARYPYAARRGNVLMSFNNKPATETIPFLSPLLAPGARALGPLLQQLATSPLRAQVESALDLLRGPASPPAVRQLIPVFDQLAPVMLDVASGRQEFAPPPAECRAIVRERYAVPRNLLVRFRDDAIDETPALAAALQGEGAQVAPVLDLSVRVLPGDHARPLVATAAVLANELPPGAAALASAAAAAGGGVIGRLADQAQAFGVPNASVLGDVGRGVSGLAAVFGGGGGQEAGGGGSGGAGGGAANDDVSVAALVDEIVGFMGIGSAGALPSSGAAQGARY